MGSIYGIGAALYDNAPFQSSAQLAYNQSRTQIDPSTGQEFVESPTVRNAVYMGQEPPVPTQQNLTAYAVRGDIVGDARVLTGQSLVTHQLNPHANLGPIQSHDKALVVALLWAQTNQHRDWSTIGQQLMNAYFSTEVANAAQVGPKISGAPEPDDKMRQAIAYTAIDSGTKPFGDQALKAMFGDGDELGNLYEKSDVNEILSDANVKSGFAEIAVQYAAELAIQKSTSSSDGKGVIDFDSSKDIILVDIDKDKWTNSTSDKGVNVVGRDKIAEAALQASGADRGDWAGNIADKDQQIAHLKTQFDTKDRQIETLFIEQREGQ